MKLTIKQTKLFEHLNYVIRGISNKNLIPILNCIKFELTNDGLYLTSTDNEISIKTFIGKKDIESIDRLGEIVVSGRYIYEIIRKLPNEIINIEEVVDSKISIYTENSSFNLNCNNIGDFPNIVIDDSKNPFGVKQRIFKNIINQTAFATSTQESRPVLTGINFKIEHDTLECTATDSYRLAKAKIKINTDLPEIINVIIPTKNLLELIRLFNDDEDYINIHVFNNKVIFKFGSIVFISKLINGSYPDTSKLIPTTFEVTMKVNHNEFFGTIDRASLLTNEADKNTIKLDNKGNEITISSNIPEIGNVEEKMIVSKDNDQDIRIAFSSKYMLDALKAFDCEDVELLFNGEVSPIIVKNPNTDNLIQLILPIRTY